MAKAVGAVRPGPGRKRSAKKGDGYNLVLAGVGGQGILLAGRVLCQAAMMEGHPVNSFESHGMAQRGGAVQSQVRWGRKARSSLILEGGTDMVVAFEPVEALRCLPLLGKGTIAVLNTRTIPPITVSSVPGSRYPKAVDVVKALRPLVGAVITIDGTGLAEEAGSVAVLSMVMVGAAWATKKMPLGKERLKEAIREVFPERLLDKNLRAFDLGARAIGSEGRAKG